MSLLLIGSERFAEHVTPPGHVERVERAHVLDAVAIEWRQRGGRVAEPRPATREELQRIHSREYCDRITATAGRAVMLDPDTFTSSESHEVALLAAGAVVVGLEHAVTHKAPALALVRPPGHHAERDRAMGFCLYNNVAIGAAAALARGFTRVAVVDFDVHHGNGTQWSFYDDPRVLFISTHQYPFWPGTGAATDVGHGKGEGFTINVPLPAGCGDADYDLVFRAIINPVLAEFAPEVLFVSIGMDAHMRDPLASMQVTTAGYRRMIDYLWTTATAVSDGRLVAVTEGGYDLQALGEGLDQTVQALSAPVRLPEPLPDDSADSRANARGGAVRGRAAVNAVLAVQAAYWPTL